MDTRRVVLFNSPVSQNRKDEIEEGNEHLRVGIASIAAYLKHKGISVLIIDTEDLPSIKKMLHVFSPQFTGLPAYTCEVYDTARTAKMVKEIVPESRIVVGGPHPSALPEETLREFPVFDMAVIGEGEKTFYEIVRGDTRVEELKGVAYARNGSIYVNPMAGSLEPLDSLPTPAWDLYNLDRYKKIFWGKTRNAFKIVKDNDMLFLPIESMRGCPFECLFCFRLNERRVRYRSPLRVAEELGRGIEQFNAGRFYFVDPTFGINKQYALELCDLIIKKRLQERIGWEVSSRVDVMDEELLKSMKKAGCDTIGFGIESGNDEVLEQTGKHTNKRMILDVIKLCNKIGITVGSTFIFGHPYESSQRINETIKFARSLPIATASFAIMVPFPGTKIYEMAKRNLGGFRILTKQWDAYGKQVGMAMELENVPQKELLKLQAKAYIYFYCSFRRIAFLLRHLTFARALYAFKRFLFLLRFDKRN